MRLLSLDFLWKLNSISEERGPFEYKFRRNSSAEAHTYSRVRQRKTNGERRFVKLVSMLI